MRAFLEKSNKEWYDDFVYISKQPLIDRGYTIVPFDGDDMDRSLVPMNININTDICIGSVQATVKFFELCGIKTPKYLGYPEHLKPYLGRKIEHTTFGKLGTDFPFFVKPSNDVKMFTGDVVENPKHLEYLLKFGECLPDTPVLKSEIVEFITEYRIFISLGKVYGMKHYKGDYMKFIDTNVILNMINDFTNCPSAFTLDVGLTNDGRTLLVEVNDMWAIGSYGLDGKDYSLLCERRMKEILKSK